MKDKNAKYTLSILIGTMVLLLIVGTSYAYLASRRDIEANKNKEITDMRAATMSDLKLVYNDCTEKSCENISGNIALGSSIKKRFEVTNSSGYDLKYSLFFQDILNTFKNDELVYKIVSLDTGETLVSTRPVPLKEHIGIDELIKEDIAIEDGTTQKYEVTITFLNTDYDQSDNSDAEFFLSIGFIESYRKPVPIVKAYSRTSTPDFKSPTQTDEGIYEKLETAGTTYYYRGNVENNHVEFAGHYWRIVRINEDGGVRLAYDGTTAHKNGDTSTDRLINGNVQYSNIEETLNAWYKENIADKGYDTYVASKVFCHNTNPSLKTSTNISLSCSNNLNSTSTKIGLLTAEELIASGVGAYETGSAKNYLYRGSEYWLQTNDDENTSYIVTGSIPTKLSSKSTLETSGLLPVINLTSDSAKNLKGAGTIDSPYKF